MMKVYDLNGTEMELSVGSIIFDAENPKDIERLKKIPAIQNFISSIGSLNGGEPYGTGNKVRQICPKLNEGKGYKVLSRNNEDIVMCKEMIPIQKITYGSNFQQYGLIYCDIFKGEKCFLTYEIKNGEFTYDFTRHCALRNNDLELNSKRISIIPVKIENNQRKLSKQNNEI